jgi:sulfatase modifying factor 1
MRRSWLVCAFAGTVALGCAKLAGYDGYTFDGQSGASGGQDGRGGSDGSQASAGTGGATASGGTVTGGVGGKATGGKVTGGTTSGGRSSGGTASGGRSSGGTASGGRSSGGTSTGGATGGTAPAGGTPPSGGTGAGGSAAGGAAASGGATAGGGGGAGSAEPPSCQRATFLCGSPGESCCTTVQLDGGQFPMGRGVGADVYPSGGTQEVPEHSAIVGSFSLDKYEVTVGRMRAFLNDYSRWRQAGNPIANAGASPNVTSGATGWQSAWPSPADATNIDANLRSCTPTTWTAGNDSYPINCVNWYEAFVFCVWDGGRLPTEAEWEFAATGGDANRLYPWGPEAPDSTRANYNGCTGCPNSPFVAVGSCLAGAARWGHADLAGSVWEWILDWYQSDWYSAGGNSCDNCANLGPATLHVRRGGSWGDIPENIRAATRSFGNPGFHDLYTGFRCARDP